MCGIAGIFHYQNTRTIDIDSLRTMRTALSHRGPDGQGIFVNDDCSLGLASTRLAIQDLSSAGNQPLLDVAKGVAVVFNGELYNANALRRALSSDGAAFHTSSDTEVLLRLYCEVGEAILDQLDGIFAFAIWDERKHTLFAARDHLGVKPLYYADHQGTFAFASEPKALLTLADVPSSINESAIASYLTFSCCPGPRTLFEHVSKVPAGTSLTVRRGSVPSRRRYWRPINPSLLELTSTATQAECVTLVRDRLRAAVSKQLAGDVPVTCSLSGGVDSSAIASLISEISSQRMTYFTIGFTDEWASHNEFAFARLVAERAGADLIELRVGAHDLLDFLQTRFAECCDDPNADPVCGLSYFLSSTMRRHGFKVAMSGEGSDELFLGYDHYVQDLTRWQAGSDPAGDFSRAYWGNGIAFRTDELPDLLTPEFRQHWYNLAQHRAPVTAAHSAALEAVEPSDLPRRLSLMELQIRLPEMLLMRADKMTMANSVECRVPFLDKDLVELALAIRADLKVEAGQAKAILKKAVETMIPAENIHRKKMGFHLPLTAWFQSAEVGPILADLLLQSRLMESGILNRPVVETFIAEQRAGSRDLRFRLWTLLTLALWYERWAA